ncbi:27150_t:CDS:1, partial [Dentiscutata erythropus]
LNDLEKRASHLEKLNLFYKEYVFGTSLLDFVKVDSPCIYKIDSDISLILNNNENDNIDELSNELVLLDLELYINVYK